MEKRKFALKSKSWTAILTIPAVVFGTILGLTQSGKTATPRISCNTETDTPNVVASFTQGDKSIEAIMLRFLPQYFSSQAALENCQATADTLQTLYQADEMKYLASDIQKDHPVVCAVARRGIGCNHYNAQLLFSVEQQVSPAQILYDMLGDDFKQSELPVPRTVSRIYTDLKPAWWPF